ncbi:MAG: hypothetical protein KA198_09645 [Chitinophagaceae bacterium]|nr:hypothetical protein [Chitinophagaceae bacterium]
MKKPLFDDDDTFYVNQEGNYVFTAQYLLQRGYCCGNGCLHCPFDYKNVVDELKKMKLQQQQQANENKL